MSFLSPAGPKAKIGPWEGIVDLWPRRQNEYWRGFCPFMGIGVGKDDSANINQLCVFDTLLPLAEMTAII